MYLMSNTHYQTVQAVLQRLVERVDEAFTTALDAQRVAAASGQSATRLQEVLWQGVGQALQTLQSSVIEACLLQRVLAKKRDPLTHVLFLEEVTVGGGPGPLAFLWCVDHDGQKWLLVCIKWLLVTQCGQG